MIFTERSCGSIASWMSRHLMPACTRTTRFAASSDSTLFMPRMSRCSEPGSAICPPWLKRPPPIETAPGHARSAAWISSVERGRRTSATSTGLSCETSLTTVLPARAGAGSRAATPDAAAAWRILRRLRFIYCDAVFAESAGECKHHQPQAARSEERRVGKECRDRDVTGVQTCALPICRTSATSTGLSCETSLTTVLPARAGAGSRAATPDAAAAWRILRRLRFIYCDAVFAESAGECKHHQPQAA